MRKYQTKINSHTLLKKMKILKEIWQKIVIVTVVVEKELMVKIIFVVISDHILKMVEMMVFHSSLNDN